MGNIWFFADPHFDDENIIKYENRPFENASEMNASLITLWNETVDYDDEVYILGDFGAEGHEAEMLAQLNGTIYLVKGNHDTKSNDYYRKAGFAEVYDKPIIIDGFWILSHEPMYVNTNMPYVNVFAHVHGSPIYQTFSRYHYCVSAERTGFRPIMKEKMLSDIKNHNRYNYGQKRI